MAPTRQGFLALLALAGAALWLSWRRPAWVAGWVGVVLLALLANASPNRFADPFTFPWYHLDTRIVPNVAFFVPFFAGVTLACAAALVTRLSKRSWAMLPGTVATIAVLTFFVGLHAFRADSAYVHTNFDPNSGSLTREAVVTPASLAAFQWLHVHVAPGDTVTNEPNAGGSLWMYAEEHVAPLLGPYDTVTSADLADRLYLTDHLQSLGHDARADDVARRNHTRWVFFDTHGFPLASHVMSLLDLQHNAHLTRRFTRMMLGCSASTSECRAARQFVQELSAPTGTSSISLSRRRINRKPAWRARSSRPSHGPERDPLVTVLALRPKAPAVDVPTVLVQRKQVEPVWSPSPADTLVLCHPAAYSTPTAPPTSLTVCSCAIPICHGSGSRSAPHVGDPSRSRHG